MTNRYIFILIFSLFSYSVHSQEQYWKACTISNSEMDDAYKKLDKYDVVQIEIEKLNLLVSNKEKLTIELPISSNSSELFIVESSNTLPRELSLKYPEIKSYQGISVSNSSKTVRLDLNTTGFHAMIMENGARTFIDPVAKGDARVLIYKASDLQNSVLKSLVKTKGQLEAVHKHEHCHGHLHVQKHENEILNSSLARRSTNGTLRTYRLAALCTPQYSTAVGGGSPSKAKSLSAITTTINRVNEIYTRELGVKLVFASNTDETIYLPGDANPPRNDDDLLDELYLFVNDRIGRNNYDLSHGFSTDGGGIAWYASVCDKEQFSGGVTGSSNPVGDAFDVDFVAHELGHQFSGDHSFNGTQSNCGGNTGSDTKWEPGSGSTIMAYAGICASDNIQRNSDPYFHGGNLNIMLDYIQDGGGSTCGTSVNTGNLKPVVTVPESGKTIPSSTPFSLTGSATDGNTADVLTYCWEQIDGEGTSGPPNSVGTANAIFRSFNPTTSPTRYFPQLDDLLNRTATLGNNLPNRTRDLNFKLTIRDNQLGQGQVNDSDVLVKVDGNSGPFLVTSLSSSDMSFFVNQEVEITWDVANTDKSPVNCANVNILLSTDGGISFNEVLVASVPNDGAHTVKMPNSLTTSGRIKVEATDNFFFNINEIDFSIEAPHAPTFATSHAVDADQLCANETVQVEFSTIPFAGFNTTLNLTYDLPDGLELINAPDVKTSGTSVTFGVRSNGDLATGTYELMVIAEGGTEMKTELIPLTVVNSLDDVVVNVLSPQNNLLNAPRVVEFSWQESNLFESYNFKLGLSQDLSSAELDFNTDLNAFTNEVNFLPATEYYYEVTGFNSCNEQASSGVLSFTTADVVCQTFVNNTELPLPDGRSTFTSVLEIDLEESIIDLTVGLEGTHEYTDDISFRLRKGATNGTEIVLFEDVCNGGSGTNFDLFLNDVFIAPVPCVPDDRGDYKPKENLSSFFGQSAQGEWNLVLFDKFPNLDEGVLNKWQMEVCYVRPANSINPELSVNNITVENGGLTLTTSNLSANDPDGNNANVKYEILSETKKGFFTLKGIQLEIGQSFLQSDLNAGDVRFISMDAPDTADELIIKLIDEDNAVSNRIVLNVNLISGFSFENLGENLMVFPNPTNGKVTLSAPVSWELFNSLGQLISAGQGAELDLTTVLEGLYLLKTSSGVIKVIKK